MRTMDELDPVLMNAVHIYAIVIRLTEPQEQAKELLNQALARLEERFGENTYCASIVLFVLGGMETGAQQVQMIQRALGIQYRVYPYALESYAVAAQNMAEIYIYRSSQYDYGLQMLGVAFPVYEQMFGPESKEVMWLYLGYGRVFAEFKNPELANANLNKALAIVDSIDDPVLRADVSLNVGLSLAQLTDSAGASQYFEQAISGFESTVGIDTLPAVQSRIEYARHLQTTSAYSDAVEQLETALPFFEQTEGHGQLEFDVLSMLVEAHEDLEMRDKATEYCLAISHRNLRDSYVDYKPVLKRAPEYPTLAPGEKKTGYVIVKYTVDENGFVQSPEIVESTGSEAFHATSIEASYGFRYAPRIRDGKPVAVPGVRNKFTFTLPY